MFKKLLSLCGLVCTSLATAGTMGPICSPGPVVVPCDTRFWDFDVQGLYLKPAYSASLAFAPTIDATPGFGLANNRLVFAPADPTDLSNQQIAPDWGWGYRLKGAYHFGTGLDLEMNWSHYDVDDNLGRYRGEYWQLFPVTMLALPLEAEVANYDLYMNNTYDQVNLVMGQAVAMGLRKNARFYGGLQYASIRVNKTSVYEITTNPIFILLTGGGVRDINSTDFKGVGPVVGIDYSYALLSGLSVTANTSGSLLYGTSRFDLATAYSNALIVNSSYASKRTVVAGLEAKLGASYAYALMDGFFNLEGGYQVTNYFSALEAMPAFNGSLIKSNFGLFGPYFGVRWFG